MVGRKLIYLLLVLISAYIGLMYDGPVPGIVLAAELILFLLLFAVSWLMKRSVKVWAETVDHVVDSEERAKVKIVVSNKGWFPINDAVLRLHVSNCLDDEYDEYEINTKIPAKTSVRVPFIFSSSYCGVVQIRLEQVVVYDYLRMFRRKKKLSFVSECVIMPKLYEMQLAITENGNSLDFDSDEYDKHNSGDDPSEIFQVREYRQGDKLSRVHWKMTARLDTMMIKELSRPISNAVGIYLDLRFKTIEEAQSVFELCYSLSMALLDHECHHRIYWCGKESPLFFEEIRVQSLENITEGMGKLLTTGRRTKELYWEEFCQAHPNLPIRRMIAITCMDREQDMEEFFAPDQIVKSVLTIEDLRNLIEI